MARTSAAPPQPGLGLDAGVALAIFTVTAVVTAVVAYRQRNKAVAQRNEAVTQSRIALSRQLAAQSDKHLPDRMDVALLLGARAAAVSTTLEARQSLFEAINLEPRVHRFLWGHEGPVTSAAFSPDGKTLASGGSDKHVILWDVATGRRIQMLAAEQWVTSVAFSPDGARLAAAVAGGGRGGVVIWSSRRDGVGAGGRASSGRADHCLRSRRKDGGVRRKGWRHRAVERRDR